MAMLSVSGVAPGVAQETPSPAIRAAADRLQAAYATLLPEARALAGDVFLARRSEAEARAAMAQAVRAALEGGEAADLRARFIVDEDSAFGRCVEVSKVRVGELALARAVDGASIEAARRAYFSALDGYVRGGANDQAFDLLGQLVAPSQGRTLSALADSLLDEALPRIDVPIPDPGGRGGDILPPRPWLPPVADTKDRYIGCYRDQEQRDLSGYTFNVMGKMTVDTCLDACRARAYTYAGLQYGYFCFCGNRYGTYGNADNCDFKCHGNAQQTCGGNWTNSIYAVAAKPVAPVPSGSVAGYLGCYRDQHWSDVNGYSFSAEGKMTVEVCLDACRERAFSYAGLQYASYCFCGNRYGTYGNADNCDMKCQGNAQQICGGNAANSVYRVTAVQDIGGRARLRVSNTEAKRYRTPFDTDRNRMYSIEVSGVISDWGGISDGIDAVWCYAAWRCGPQGEPWQQLRIDEKGLSEIVGRAIPYNPQHVYRIEIPGTGAPFEFYAIDALGSASDNSGAFEVSVTEIR
jgi:hypothetical protein